MWSDDGSSGSAGARRVSRDAWITAHVRTGMSPLAVGSHHVRRSARAADSRWCAASNPAGPLHRSPTPTRAGRTFRSACTVVSRLDNQPGRRNAWEYRPVAAPGADRGIPSACMKNRCTNTGIATTAAVVSTCRSVPADSSRAPGRAFTPLPRSSTNASLRDGDFPGEINVLNRVQEGNAFLQRPLECLASGDQSHPAGAFVDHRRLHGFLQVGLPR